MKGRFFSRFHELPFFRKEDLSFHLERRAPLCQASKMFWRRPHLEEDEEESDHPEVQYIYIQTPPLRRRRFFTPWRLARYLIILGIWGTVAVGGTILWFSRDLPRPEEALDAVRRPSLVLQDKVGHTIATYGDVVGEPLRLSDLPPYLPQAAVAVEDRRFWTHSGFDPIGVARAIVVNIVAHRLVQGGSTITQQVAKTLFLSNARTVKRKAQEILLTLWLENHFTKEEILEIWLNRVYLGTGAYGVDAAAHLYFGISARHLNLWQSAVIAGLPRAPSRFNPRSDPHAAMVRGREVLAAMAANGTITTAAAKEAGNQIVFPNLPREGGWFADWASGEVASLVPPDTDAVLHTTLDPRAQKAAESSLALMLAQTGARQDVSEGAIVVLDAYTGEVRAMVGGRDYATSPFNRAVAARRQPGSSFKPFVWLTALEHGARPDDQVLDGPLTIRGWSPVDFEPGWRGEISLTDALAMSLNTVSVRLMENAGGPQAVINVAHRLGLIDKFPETPSLALGTGEAGLLEMTSAYASFFNGGKGITPHAVASITADSTTRAVALPNNTQKIDPDLAAMMVRMMGAVVSRGTGRAANVPEHFVAGKTGTTQDNRDAWFIGGIDGTIIGIWVGNDDNHPMRGVMGGGIPAHLFSIIARDLVAAHNAPVLSNSVSTNNVSSPQNR